MEIWYIIFIAIGILFLWLLTRRWFWLILIAIGGLASIFATIASIVHFQILGALGFFFLAAICWFLFSMIVNSYDHLEAKGGGATKPVAKPSGATPSAPKPTSGAPSPKAQTIMCTSCGKVIPRKEYVAHIESCEES